MKIVPLKVDGIASDVKAEVIGAGLVENGTRIDDIVIKPVGISQRNVRKDVLEIYYKQGAPDNEEYLFLDVSRESIYDTLPQGVFHQPKITGRKRTSDDLIEEMKLFKKQEEAARLFFLALEKEYGRLGLSEELEERKSILGFSEHYKYDLYLKIWPELKKIDPKYLPLLFQILPESYKISGNDKLISKLLAIVCNKPVDIKKTENSRINYSATIHNNLGSCLLGLNFILGNQYIDFDPHLEINIREIERKELADFLPNGKIRKVADLLCEHFFSYSAEINVLLFLQKEEEGIYLSDGEVVSYLGYN